MGTSTDNETVLGRATAAAAEALYMAGHSDRWLRNATATLIDHVAAELVAMEQHAGHACTLQDAVAFLAHAARGRA